MLGEKVLDFLVHSQRNSNFIDLSWERRIAECQVHPTKYTHKEAKNASLEELNCVSKITTEIKKLREEIME